MSNARILVVDDDQVIQQLLKVNLELEGYAVEVASDGEEALVLFDRFHPDLVLLDIMMPKLSGFEVCKKLKGDPTTSHIMILMVTALNELGDIERAVQAGTDDFLSKPVNKAELLKRVDNMLKLYHVTDEVERLRQYIERMESRG
jgi:two-component system, OmpR family, alkaline phosphatase synthesis response regulator PhoP